MGVILCIETSTTNCSVTLAKDGRILHTREYNAENYSHAEKLHAFIQEVLGASALSFQDLEAVAISKGPGSYTGLRIGVSAAKGLCFALDIPLISIETLAIVAQPHLTQGTDFIVPMIDARRMEVYTSVYNPAFEKLSSTEAKILNAASFEPLLTKGKVLFVGTGTEKFRKICRHPHAYFKTDYPSSKFMVKLAEECYNQGKFEDTAYFEPYYLKDFIVKP